MFATVTRGLDRLLSLRSRETPEAPPPAATLVTPLGPSSHIRFHRPAPVEGQPAREGLDGLRENRAVRAVILGAGGLASFAGMVSQAQAANHTAATTTPAAHVPRPIVYVGMNPTASYEIQQLRSALGQNAVTVVQPSSTQDRARIGNTTFDLSTDDGRLAFATALGLPADRAAALAEVLSGSENARDEIAGLAKIFREAERGQRVVERMVLSGHSVGSSVWGDHNGSISFETLGKLALVFPRAAGQVQDLMLAACYTGSEYRVDQYQAIFPNLKTLWAYDGSAPGAASGAVPHMTRWERSTRGESSSIDRDIARHTRKGENVATWSAATGYDNGQERGPISADRTRYDASHPLVAQYFSGDEVVANPQSGPLRDHYNNVQRMLGRPDLPAAERPALEAERDQVIRLLYWNNVRSMFQTVYGSDVRAAYTELGLTPPSFSSMSRKDAIEKVEAIEAKLSETPGASNATRNTVQRLRQGLIELSPSRIPAAWI